MDTVRIGIAGIGGMGASHGRYLQKGDVKRATLAAVCDVNADNLTKAKESFGDDLACFDSLGEMCASGTIDAVLIATPHYFHPEQTIESLNAGMHVMCEKPAGVYTKQVEEMNAVAAKSDKVFSMMYMMRKIAAFAKLRELVQSGELGEMQRVVWINTDWFRADSYYASGSWRATWKGEGGGVLMNQSPHNLDLWQWICGMPKRIRAHCHFGKWHDIEVEDDVTAYVEYENGATGVYITTTGDYPGTNRLEITGDRGRAVLENDSLTFHRVPQSVREFSKGSTQMVGGLSSWTCDIPVGKLFATHAGLTENFVNAILDGEELVVPGEEGINSLALANGMLLSAWTDEWIDLPLDGDRYYAELQKRIAAAEK